MQRVPNHEQGKTTRVMEHGVAFSDQTVGVTVDGNGIAHLDIPSGKATICVAIPVSQLIRNMAACNKAIAEWRVDQSGKVEYLDEWRSHAASS
jgi:hypothetical protein